MDFIFADDSRQNHPSRHGMGPLIAIGGIFVSYERVKPLNDAIQNICLRYGFPSRERFKWSPGRELWMRTNLVDDRRREFFIEVLNAGIDAGIEAAVVINDSSYSRATRGAPSHEIDVVRLFFERVNWYLTRLRSQGVIIVDRPSGDRAQEDRFLFECVETIEGGTEYISPDRFVMNVLSSSSNHLRLLQLADLIVSCSVARVGGEDTYSIPIFEVIKRMLRSEGGRRGGVGLKIHPDYRYANLYHWLLGDESVIKGLAGASLPLMNRCYATDPYIP